MFDYTSKLMAVTEKTLQYFVLERIKKCDIEKTWRKDIAEFIEEQYPKHVSQYEKIHLFLQNRSYEELQIELFDITLLSTLLEFCDLFISLYSLESKQHMNRVRNHIRLLRESRNALEHDAKTPEVVKSRDHFFEQLNAIYCINGFCSIVLNFFSDDDYWKKTLKDMRKMENMLFGEEWMLHSDENEFNTGESLSDLIDLADKGNADAQFTVGKIFYDGERVNADYDRAFMWFRKAALKGHAEAMYYIGRCYNQGFGVDYDFAKGDEYYRKSAELGYPRALTEMANLVLMKDSKSPKNIKESYEWAKKAAGAGDPGGFWILSIHYGMGGAVKKDLDKMRELQEKAANHGYIFACEHLATEAHRANNVEDELHWLEYQLSLEKDNRRRQSLQRRIKRIKSK